MSERRTVGVLAVVAVLAAGLAARTWLLRHSPLPATLDGVRYAALARDTLATGAIPVAEIDSDELVFTAIVATASAVTGVSPLHLAQPVAACLGAAAALTGVVVAARIGRGRSWPPRRVRRAAILAGLTLAVEGLFLRRTGVPDEEVAALLALPLVALAADRTLRTRRWPWAVAFVAFAVVFPPLHNFSAAVAALVVTAVVAVRVARDPTRRTAGLGLAVLLAFWGLFLGYFTLAESLGLALTYTGLLREHPGLFVGWVLLLAVGSAWFQGASERAQRTAFLLPLGLLFAVVAANAVSPVFPQTLATPVPILATVALFSVPVVLFGWGVSTLTRGGVADDAGPFVYALAAGPLAMVLFTLTTALTPAFFGAALRAQSFAHHAIFGLAAVAAVGLASSRRGAVGRLAVGALVLVALLSMPLGYVHLDTAAYPATVHESEFGAADFARTRAVGEYTADHRLAALGSLYRFEGAAGSSGATRTWLVDGRPPDCPTVVQRAWTRSGAHFYPTSPRTLPPRAYERWIEANHAVYDVGGYTETTIVVPRTADRPGC